AESQRRERQKPPKKLAICFCREHCLCEDTGCDGFCTLTRAIAKPCSRITLPRAEEHDRRRPNHLVRISHRSRAKVPGRLFREPRDDSRLFVVLRRRAQISQRATLDGEQIPESNRERIWEHVFDAAVTQAFLLRLPYL